MTSLADGIRNACEIARHDERKKCINKVVEMVVFNYDKWVFEGYTASMVADAILEEMEG